VSLEKEHKTNDSFIDRLTDAARVALYEVFLESRKVVGRDSAVAKRSETCSHAIDRLRSVFHLAVEVVTTVLDFSYSLVREHEFSLIFEKLLDKIIGKFA
jgi:hypothetical protein